MLIPHSGTTHLVPRRIGRQATARRWRASLRLASVAKAQVKRRNASSRVAPDVLLAVEQVVIVVRPLAARVELWFREHPHANILQRSIARLIKSLSSGRLNLMECMRYSW